jgi:hypothetical protein
MADDKIALSIEIEADRAQMSLGELEAGFEELQTKLKATNRGTEEGRKEFKKLASQMAQTSKEIKNIELSFEGLDREQVASEIGSVAGAVGDLSASLIILSGDNETLQATAQNIEKAMMVSMGLKGAIEGLSSARKLYNNLIKQANEDEKEGIALTVLKTAKEKAAAAGTLILNTVNKLLNTTLKMNPIGLIVIAITAVVAAIVYFGDAIWGLIKTALKPFQFIIDILIDGLQAMGIMASDEAIAQEEAAKKAVEAAKKRNEAAAEQRRVHKELTESMVADLDFEIRKRTIAGEDYAELSRKKIELLKEVAEEESKAAENNRIALEQSMKAMGSFGKFYKELYDETTEIAKKAAADARKLSEDLTAHDLEQAQKRKEERKAQREKDNNQLIEEAKALAEFNEEQARIKIQLIQDEGERARAEIKYNSELELEALEKKGQDTFDARMLIAQTKNKALADLEKAEEDKRFALEKEAQAKRDEYDKLLFDAKLANEQEETEKKKLQLEEDYQNNITRLEEEGLLTMELEFELAYAREQALFDINEEFREKERQGRLALNQERLESATQVIGAIGSLNSAALATDLKNAGDNEALKERLRKASFEREKKLNIAMALINGAQAQMSILAQTPKADFGIATAIAMGAAAITTLAQIAAIKSTTYQGGGGVATSPSADVSGAGGAGAGAQINAVTNTSTILGNQQVYVTETDITTTQNNVSVIEESATF